MSTISGLNFAVAKGFCKVLFGENILSIEKREKESRFDVYLKSKVDRDIVINLRKRYPSFHVFFINPQEII